MRYRLRFYEVHAVVYGIDIRAIGWNYFDLPIIIFIKAPFIYYYNYEKRTLERCIDFWYIYREKRIGSCEEISDFTIHIFPKRLGYFGATARW